MEIKNKGYAAYLVIVHGYKYEIKNNQVYIDIDLPTHDKVYLSYKNSNHRKIHKLFIKLMSIK